MIGTALSPRKIQVFSHFIIIIPVIIIPLINGWLIMHLPKDNNISVIQMIDIVSSSV